MKNTSITLTALAVVSLAFAPSADAASIWINELHYDNTGGDVGEFIELAGVAGTDLSGYSLWRYNGSNGETLGTASNLTGTIPDQQNGFGTVLINFSPGSLQNDLEGIALALSGALVEFVSYEGQFEGAEGPADGIDSANIGISESGSGPIGGSLGLIGHGSSRADFVWTTFTLGNPGQVNSGQTFAGQTFGIPDGGTTALLLLAALTPMAVFANRRRKIGIN